MADPQADKAATTADETVKAARVTVRILEQLATHDEMGVTELARETGMNKARAFRYLRTLVALGYAIQFEGSERYARGPKMQALARVIGQSAEEGVVDLARPVLQRLHETFDHTFNLSLVYGDSVTIVETLPGRGLVGIVVQVNQQLPLHSTAAGKLLLADRLERSGDLPCGELERFTPHTILDREALRRDIEDVVRKGWADAPEEVVLGINAVSVPIHDHRGELVAMLTAMDSIQFITREPSQTLVETLRDAAAEVSAALTV
ncbi:IclR family transcriptional regulator [Alteraurantiacibacter aquimixticola]|nr:IclR family transcriptional regulator [Alteraurantiacibacter aquimixticola]